MPTVNEKARLVVDYLRKHGSDKPVEVQVGPCLAAASARPQRGRIMAPAGLCEASAAAASQQSPLPAARGGVPEAGPSCRRPAWPDGPLWLQHAMKRLTMDLILETGGYGVKVDALSFGHCQVRSAHAGPPAGRLRVECRAWNALPLIHSARSRGRPDLHASGCTCQACAGVSAMPGTGPWQRRLLTLLQEPGCALGGPGWQTHHAAACRRWRTSALSSWRRRCAASTPCGGPSSSGGPSPSRPRTSSPRTTGARPCSWHTVQAQQGSGERLAQCSGPGLGGRQRAAAWTGHSRLAAEGWRKQHPML